ncbi:MAG: DM9 repeat-containing protein [Candidatus Acidiferrales bacterium]
MATQNLMRPQANEPEKDNRAKQVTFRLIALLVVGIALFVIGVYITVSSVSTELHEAQGDLVDPATHDWFKNGAAQLWYSRVNGQLRFYDGPGVDSITHEELQPVTKEMYASWKQSKTNALRWVTAGPGVKGVQGGFDVSFRANQPILLYVCRAELLGGVWPGKDFVGNCYIGLEGKEFVVNAYELLTGSGGEWRSPERSLARAVAGGKGNHNETIYVCRANYLTFGLQIGHTVGDTCDIGFRGQEYELPLPFEIFYRTEQQKSGPE